MIGRDLGSPTGARSASALRFERACSCGAACDTPVASAEILAALERAWQHVHGGVNHTPLSRVAHWELLAERLAAGTRTYQKYRVWP